MVEEKTANLEDAYALVAQELVSTVLHNVLSRPSFIAEQGSSENDEAQPQPCCEQPDSDVSIPTTEWPTIESFNKKLAEEKLNEFISTWTYSTSWLYCIDFLTEKEHDFDVRFQFRARFSIPTRRRPIPRTTASVYFTFVISKFKPKTTPVDVFFVVESQRLVHRPGQSLFRERWLQDVVDVKDRVFDAAVF